MNRYVIMHRAAVPGTKKTICLISAVLLLSSLFMVTSCSDSKKFPERFSKYAKTCTELSEYFQDIADGSGEYYLHYDSEKDEYRLSVRSEDDNYTHLDLPSDMKPGLDSLDKAFYEVTHRNGPNLIYVTEDHVIFAEDGYYGCMIYSKDGSIDRTTKNKWCSQEYQRFYRLNDNWYSVYIDLI